VGVGIGEREREREYILKKEPTTLALPIATSSRFGET
jgi:hypothetical protein